jgi:hypothetical protein
MIEFVTELYNRVRATCLTPRRLFRSATAARGFGLAIQLGW